MNVVELTFARPLLLWPAGPDSAQPRVPRRCAWVAAGRAGRSRCAPVCARHPIPIAAHLKSCLTLTYALPAAVLEPLLPPGLELDTVGG